MGSSGSAFRDVALAIGIVGGVLGLLFVYTGVWPPMVVVESGSMMHTACEAPGVPEHCDPQVGYGKFGTIDPGDMVFVKKVTSPDEIRPMAQAAEERPDERTYGRPGDVVVYFVNGDTSRTPIIHRAIAWVEATGVSDEGRCATSGDPGPNTQYRVFWDGRDHTFRAADGGIYLPSMGFGEPAYREDRGFKPCWSGFITKGDNPITNRQPDQATGGIQLPRQPVRMDWVQGKAVGELPWFGLIKLAVSGDARNPNYVCPGMHGDPACQDVVRIINANAPGDLWVMLGVSLAAIAVAPLGYDLYLIRRERMRLAGGEEDDGEVSGPGGEDDDGPGATSPAAPRFSRLDQAEAEPLPEDEGVDPRQAFAPPRHAETPRRPAPEEK